MELEEQKPATTFFETKTNGDIHEIDMFTGEVVQSTGVMPYNPKKKWVYCPSVVDNIVQTMIEEGLSLSKVCAKDKFPSLAVLARWRATFPKVDIEISMARKMVAQQFHDQIIEELEDNELPDKLKFEKLKYLASVNDPDRYSTRTKVSGDKDAPVQIVVSTGIVR